MKKADLILPCRVTGTRLYGKPLQFIDIEQRLTILENLVKYFDDTGLIENVCLAISDEEENYGFIRLAEKHGWKYIMGHPLNVLGRINKAIDHLKSETIFLISTENPFVFVEGLRALYESHMAGGYDYSMFSNLPEGSVVGLIKAEALKISERDGFDRHRSELVTSYIFDNKEKFKLNIVEPDKKYQRPDVRITVDYPEDVAFCRRIYSAMNGRKQLVSIAQVIEFWDGDAESRKLVESIGIDWGHGRLWS
jgi:spore coat polysaccharide biosynthesis protein SpsF (cytidylyltransferase family)